MRKAQRCAHSKNGDMHITHLRRRVSHYRVIGHAWSGTSLISIHGRRVTLECVTYFISDWCPYATNPRCVLTVLVSCF
jgi:hypothetical protein